jgi:hypothetical protein
MRASADAVEALLDGDLREIGASGRYWTRPDTIEALTASARSMGGPIQDDDMDARRLSEDLVLLTYVSTAGDRRAVAHPCGVDPMASGGSCITEGRC